MSKRFFPRRVSSEKFINIKQKMLIQVSIFLIIENKFKRVTKSPFNVVSSLYTVEFVI